MIALRQKGELEVSGNRSSGVLCFYWKMVNSIHRAANTSEVHNALQGNPGMWDGRELQCARCEWHGEPPATFTAVGP